MELNKELIEKLANGEIAVKFEEGTIEELDKIISTAFPKDRSSVFNYEEGTHFYAYRNHNGELDGDWDFSTLPFMDYNIYTINHFFSVVIGYKLKEEYNHCKKAIRAIVDAEWFDLNWDSNLEEKGWNFGSHSNNTPINLKTHDTCRALDDAGVLNTWFEPIYRRYKPSFELGDIVVIHSDHHYEGYKAKIIEDNPNYLPIDESQITCDIPHNTGGGYLVRKSNIRKATPKEIEEYNKSNYLPNINGYEGKLIEDNKFIMYGNNCAKLTVEWFRSSGTRQIKSLVLNSGVKLEEQDMEQIRKFLKKKGII